MSYIVYKGAPERKKLVRENMKQLCEVLGDAYEEFLAWAGGDVITIEIFWEEIEEKINSWKMGEFEPGSHNGIHGFTTFSLPRPLHRLRSMRRVLSHGLPRNGRTVAVATPAGRLHFVWRLRRSVPDGRDRRRA